MAPLPPALSGRIRFERYSVDDSGTVFADPQVREFSSVVAFLNETFARMNPLGQGGGGGGGGGTTAILPAVMALFDSYRGQIHECTFENPDLPGSLCHWHE